MNTKSLVVGQEVTIAHSGSWSTHYNFGYRVAKVTPSGQVVVRRESDGYERRFDKAGREMGKSYSVDYLCADVEVIRESEAKRLRANKAAAAIEAVRVDKCLGTYGVEYMAQQLEQLQKLLDEAKAAVAAIEVGEED